jgi:hypothetical protein
MAPNISFLCHIYIYIISKIPGLRIKVPQIFLFDVIFPSFFFQVSKYSSPNTSLFMPYFKAFSSRSQNKGPQIFLFDVIFPSFFFQVSKYSSPNTSLSMPYFKV